MGFESYGLFVKNFKTFFFFFTSQNIKHIIYFKKIINIIYIYIYICLGRRLFMYKYFFIGVFITCITNKNNNFF
jgi:hypothetical protein